MTWCWILQLRGYYCNKSSVRLVLWLVAGEYLSRPPLCGGWQLWRPRIKALTAHAQS
jgi:hypothetical protein